MRFTLNEWASIGWRPDSIFEVCVRIQVLLSSAGLLAISVASCFAQTPAEPATVPQQQTPAIVPVRPPPAPNTDVIPAMPPYEGQRDRPASVPPAEAKPGVASVPNDAPTADAAMPPYLPYGTPDEDRAPSHDGSTYIPVDSWIYTEMTRLYSLGYVDTMFLGMRPWTRLSVLHMLDESEDAIRDSGEQEAQEILVVLQRELRIENADASGHRGNVYGTDSIYARAMGIGGPILRDSYHLGQSIDNDYGRPYQSGFNMIAGASSVVEYGRFSLYVRGEYQHSPAADGYTQALTQYLALNDGVPTTYRNPTIPSGPIAAQNPFRLQEAVLSFHILGHEISGGKSDAWLGPAQGGALAWSNNAEDIYSFRINRVEPLHIPLLSALLGPLRYDFFFGSLKGHSAPNHPYTDSAMFSFRPTRNFEFGFQRTIVFGGAGHSPVTFGKFFHSFFNLNDTTPAVKLSRNDPGARFSDFNASYRLPFVRKYLTFYVDSISHDDVTPISAPRRASYRTGLYLAKVPGINKLDLRVEAVSTDPRVSVSSNGFFMYYESIQRQAYTNQGLIFGDSIGREAKGGQAWLTYHLSGKEWIRAEYLNKKTDKDFSGGTTQNQFKASVVKRFYNDAFEVNAWYQYERWKAPFYKRGSNSDSTAAFQVTFFPGLKSAHQQ